MTTISSYQLFSLMVLFQFGTTVIFGYGSESGRDAWITASISSLIGGGLIAGYVLISKINAYASPVKWFPNWLGKWVGTPIAWLYPLFFVYTASRIICDLRFLLPLTLLPKTPDWFFIGVLMLLIMYLLFAGPEVLLRIAGILLPSIVIFILVEAIVLLASGSLHGDYLKPMFAEGYGRILRNVWPVGITTTYGESLAVCVFWCLLNKKENLGRVSVGSALFAGLFFVFFDVISIAALGESLFKKMIFPAFTILKLTSVANFLENMEVFGAMYFMCTAFIKISVYMLAAVICIRDLTYSVNDRITIWVVTLSAYLIAMTMAINLSDHIQVWVGDITNIIVVPLYIILPALILMLSGFSKLKKR